jgi:hypothetical protein
MSYLGSRLEAAPKRSFPSLGPRHAQLCPAVVLGTAGRLSDAARDHNVIGDVIGMILALVTLVALRLRAGFASVLVWLLVAETIYDIGTGMPQAVRDHTLGLVNGLTWLVLVYYVPVVLVALALTVWQLIARRAERVAVTVPYSTGVRTS